MQNIDADNDALYAHRTFQYDNDAMCAPVRMSHVLNFCADQMISSNSVHIAPCFTPYDASYDLPHLSHM